MTERLPEGSFEHLLDECIVSPTGVLPAGLDPELKAELELAGRLAQMDLSAQSTVRGSLRDRLAASPRRTYSHTVSGVVRPRLQPAAGRGWWASLAAILLVCTALAFSHTSWVSAVQRLLGYGYLSEVGFFPLDETVLITGPVRQTQGEQTLTVRQGITQSGRTTLWVESNFSLPPADQIWLDTPGGRVVAATFDPAEARLTFELAAQPDTTTFLGLPGEWRLPLEWVAAAQAGLAPTRVSLPANTPDAAKGATPCFSVKNLVRVCIQAAYADAGGTHLLLEWIPLQHGVSSSWQPLEEIGTISLRDQSGNSYLATSRRCEYEPECSLLALQYPPLPTSASSLTLHFTRLEVAIDGASPVPMQSYDLPLRLPERVPLRSPTPRAATSPNQEPQPVPHPPGK